MQLYMEEVIKQLVYSAKNKSLKYEPTAEQVAQATIKERVKQFNHEHAAFSSISVHFGNDETMTLFFEQPKACLKVYEGKRKYFTEKDLKTIYEYGLTKCFYGEKISQYKKEGWDEEFQRVVNK